MRDLKITISHTDRTEDSLYRYMGDISAIRMIDPKEEVLLARKIREGDRGAEHRLVTANLRFVISVAKKYQRLGLGMGDLISEGNLGLIKAARLFDETRGFKFISYAVWWVRQAMMTAINDYGRVIRVPMNQQLGMSQINAAAEKLEQLLQREPTLEELSETLGKREDKLAEHIQSNTRTRYLDDQILGGDTETLTLMSFVPDQNNDLIGEWVWTDARDKAINRLLSQLKCRDREVLKFAFGLCGYPLLENEDIAIRLSLSKERVRQLRTAAILQLRNIPDIIELREYA